MELSVVIPCLNEADSLAKCLDRAINAIKSSDIDGEVILADNGSEDDSLKIAEERGVRIVHVSRKGYGSALMGGIEAAAGKFIIMGDADGSYDFREIPKFVEKLRAGHDMVQGCRLPRGGGTVMPGAMPISHRLIGNPMFSMLARLMFQAPINDVYCGLRGFTKDHYKSLDQRCLGMEFAVEMVIKSSINRADIAEVPITLHPDDRVNTRPHLRTIRDGWRTLRFFLLAKPTWLFLAPGMSLLMIGTLLFFTGWTGFQVFSATLDAHTMLIGVLSMMCGLQGVVFAAFTEVFRQTSGLFKSNSLIYRLLPIFELEKSLALAVVGILVGLAMILAVTLIWAQSGFGPLNYGDTMRLIIPAVAAVALSIQLVFGSFAISFLTLNRKARDS